MAHLKKWWIAYGAAAVAAAHNAWPQVREAVCSNPKITGGAFVAIVLAALLKTSPTTKVVQ